MRSKSTRRRWLSGAFLPVVLGLAAGCLLPSMALAGSQSQGSAGPQHQLRRPLNGSSLDVRVNKFATSLGLSDAQRSAVKRILEQRQLQILRIRGNASISGSERIDQFRALQDKTVEQIRAVLNDEQKKKYNPLAPRGLPQSPQPSVEDWIKAATAH